MLFSVPFVQDQKKLDAVNVVVLALYNFSLERVSREYSANGEIHCWNIDTREITPGRDIRGRNRLNSFFVDVWRITFDCLHICKLIE